MTEITIVDGTVEPYHSCPQPSDIGTTLYIGLQEGGKVGENRFWSSVIRNEVESYFGCDVRVEEIDLDTNSSHGMTVGFQFSGTLIIGNERQEFVAAYFGGETGVLPEKSGLVDDGLDITTVEELEEFWDEDWGNLKINYPEQNVIIDSRGTPQSVIDHVLEYRGSGMTVNVVNDRGDGMESFSDDSRTGMRSPDVVEKISEQRSRKDDDTSCTGGGDSDDQHHTESKSFHEQMCELADDLDEKQRRKEEERVNEYLRENRDVFKAEILDVRGREHSCVVTLDIPTHGEEKFTFRLPDSDGRSGKRLYEILGYLGATLRDMDMVEGMYLPVTYVDKDKWCIHLPSDESGHGPTTWSSLFSTRTIVEPMGSLACAIPRLSWNLLPSVSLPSLGTLVRCILVPFTSFIFQRREYERLYEVPSRYFYIDMFYEFIVGTAILVYLANVAPL